MHPLVKVAKETVEKYVREGKTIPLPDNLTPEMREKTGVFVSIKKRGGLRGCIGTFSPTRENVVAEIIQNAVSASTHDPRFSAVDSIELNELEYSVDVLSEPEKVAGKNELNPKRYGVIVRSGELRGLLLPDLKGVDTVEEQLRIASLKAGITPGEDIELYRFEVKRYR